MKKNTIILMLTMLLFLLSACVPARQTVAVLPLDHRPCNTSESQLLAQAADRRMLLPRDNGQDFNQPADPRFYWHWLENVDADRYIIFTNGLLNGGLIASRNLDTYRHSDDFLVRLEKWLERHPDKDITLVTVLPRMLPSQLDSLTYPYGQALMQWGAAYDEAMAKGKAAPPPPAQVPPAVVDRYFNLFAENQKICSALANFEASGLCDRFLIALDDNATHCLSRNVVRTLSQLPKSPIVNGADELTGMLLTERTEPVPITIHYTDPTASQAIPEFEGQSLADTVQEKCAFMGFVATPNADLHLFVHNKPGDIALLAEQLSQLPEEARIGVADVAYTNRGDIALWPWLSSKPENLVAYSGWNTSANSIGTTLAACRSAHDLSPQRRSRAFLQHYLDLRLAIDQGYLAHLAPNLRTEWEERGLTNRNGTFANDAARDTCTTELNAAFAGWAAPLGLSPEARLYFPWSRTFEVGYNK